MIVRPRWAFPRKLGARCLQELQNPLTRYLFGREQYNGQTWCKFHGVLKIDVEETEASLRAGENACVYVKVADECPCPIADWRLAEISDADFTGYAFREPETWFRCGVITVPALSFRETNKNNNSELAFRAPDGGFTAEGESVMKDKIRTIYRIDAASIKS